MKKTRLFSLSFLLLALIIAGWRGLSGAVTTTLPAPTAASSNPATKATNVILFVGDGMGSEHIRATGYFLGRPLRFESFPYSSVITTDSVDGLTDSAAAATAMATGRRVFNEVISVALPGDGSELPTVLDAWQAQGKRVGLATTSYMTDATGAAFGAHEPSRDNLASIADDYLNDSRPNVLMGGGGEGMTHTAALAAGYVVVTDTVAMQAVDTEAFSYISGQFGTDSLPPLNHGRGSLPTLAQMTETALEVLEQSESGFFLLVEQEGTDSYSHGNNLELVVDATIELEEAVNTALEWAESDGNTLVVVASDHETGGLTVIQDNGPGQLPDVTWDRTSHTDTPVPIYAFGPGAEQVQQVTDVTEVHDVLLPAPPDVSELDYAIYLPDLYSEPR